MNESKTSQLMTKKLNRSKENCKIINLEIDGILQECFLFTDYNILVTPHTYKRMKSRTQFANPFKNVAWIKNALEDGVYINTKKHHKLFDVLSMKHGKISDMPINFSYIVYNNMRLYVDYIDEVPLIRTVVPFTVLSQNTNGCIAYREKLVEVFNNENFSCSDMNKMFSDNISKIKNAESRLLIRDLVNYHATNNER